MTDRDESFHVTSTDEVLAPLLEQIARAAERRLTQAAGEPVGLFILAGRVDTYRCDMAMTTPEMLKVVASAINDIYSRLAAYRPH